VSVAQRGSVARISAQLEACGLDLAAPLDRDSYDACVAPAWRCARLRPDCRSVLIVGNAGRAFWTHLARAPEAMDPEHPVDRYAGRVVAQAVRTVDPSAAIAHYWETRDGEFLPLVALAERAGLGRRGRIGLLIHPRYGPWVSLRAALFLDEEVASAGALAKASCEGCSAPCQLACHGNAVAPYGLDLDRCAATKREHPACASGCDARLACIVGREHAFTREQIVHHSRSRAAGVRWPTEQ
jgi:epoxyqueuosine reductase